MSETTTDPPGGGEHQAEPAAPADTERLPAPETGAEAPAEPEAKPNHEARRWAAMSARLSAAENERAQLAAEVEQIRRGAPPPPDQPQLTPEQQAYVDHQVQQALVQSQQETRVKAFHAAGHAAYPDWQSRCSSLMEMGADRNLAALLVETPDGPRVAAALVDDPAALEAIAALKTERGRALALGKFVATLGDRPAPVNRAVSRAPPPIKPIGSGTSRASFDEYSAPMGALLDHYSRDAMAKRNAR